MVAVVLAALSLSVGCLVCPEGSVKCVMVGTILEVDPVNQTFTVRRTLYKTCVPAGTCPAPPDGMFDTGSSGDGIDWIAMQLAAMAGRLDRTDLRIDVDSEVAQQGKLTGAEVKLRLARLDAAGELLRQSEYGGPLELVEDRGDGWSFIPAADPTLRDYVAEAMRLAAGSAEDEQVVFEYAVTLGFDRAIGALETEDIRTEIKLAGHRL